MSSFAALLAQAQAKTQAKAAAVQTALQQREARQQAEKEAAERKHAEELTRQAKIREIKADHERKEEERKKERERAKEALEKERERKMKTQMDKLLGKRLAERDREDRVASSPSRGGGGGGGGGSPRKKRSRSESPDGRTGAPALTRMERRALKTDPNARPTWAINLVGDRGARSAGSPPRTSAPKGKERKPTGNSSAKQPDGKDAVKLGAAKRDTRTQADLIEEKRRKKDQEQRSQHTDTGFFSNRNSRPQTLSRSPAVPSRGNSSGPAMQSRSTSAPTFGAGRKQGHSSASPLDSYGSEEDDYESDESMGPPTKRRKHMGGGVLARYGISLPQYHHSGDISDDDDMEVNAAELEREEKRALKEAKREDEMALAEERRHEEEKRRRKLAKAGKP